MSETIETTIVLDSDAVAKVVHKLAQEIVEANPDVSSLALMGILSRGKPLAWRLANQIEAMTGRAPRVGWLATTLYRDDVRTRVRPAKVGSGDTHFDFNVDGLTVIMVDDVMYTGRTIRAAMDEIMDYGRPRRIQLACLVDRGLRELPIQPDYLGWSLATKAEDHVSVKLQEMDGEDVVLLERVCADPGSEHDIV